MKFKFFLSPKICIPIIIGLLIPLSVSGFHVGIIGDRTGGADQEVFQSIVKEIEQLKPDWVINVGDLIEGPQPDAQSIQKQWDIVMDTLKMLSMPMYYVPGNNDIFNETSRKIYPQRTGNQPYYSFDYQDVHWVVLDNSQARNIDQMGTDQLQWLKSDLESHTDTLMTCVFFHKPFWYGLFKDNDTNQLHEIFKLYGVDWVFSGHYHSYASTIRDEIQYVMVGSSGGHIGNNPAQGDFYQFGWFTVQNGKGHFSLINSGSVMDKDFLTLDVRHAQDKIEEKFLVLKPVILKDNRCSGGEIKLLSLSFLHDSGKEQYVWNTENTSWEIEPGSGYYQLNENGVWSISFSADKDGSTYPLPMLQIETAINNDRKYPLLRRMKITRNVITSSQKDVPVLNGNLTEKCWEKAEFIGGFGGLDGDANSVEPVNIRMFYHRKHLYIGVEAEESNVDKMVVVGSHRDDFVFRGDCIYLMFWDSIDPTGIIQTVINPDGIFMDQKGVVVPESHDRPKMDLKWDGGIRVSSGKYSKGWTLEIEIPLKDLGLESGTGEVRFNAIRYQTSADDVSIWNYPATYLPKDAGIIILE